MPALVLLLLGLCGGGQLSAGSPRESGATARASPAPLSTQPSEPNTRVCAQSTAQLTHGHTLSRVSDGLQLVTSVMGASGQLVSCRLQEAPEVVASFMHLCQAGSWNKVAASTQFSGLLGGAVGQERIGAGSTGDPGPSAAKRKRSEDPAFVGFARAKLACQLLLQELEAAVPQPPAQLQRSRRGFTYPGTLWCGAGNSADSYRQLGELKETDACCREHDHCQHVIHPFTNNYGYRNMRWHTISHCACDNEMKDCLRRVNDTASRVVGQAFFNVIQVPCFEFMYEEQCVERFWYGWCKTYRKVAVAVPQAPVLYDHGGSLIDGVPTSHPKNETTHYSILPQGSSTARPATSTTRPLRTVTRTFRTPAWLPGTKAWSPGTTAQPLAPTAGPLGTETQSIGVTARPPRITVELSPDTPSEEPTIGQVIQATENLLKVMVTTISPSTATDAKTDSPAKKQRKNKKKNEKKHRKGKGRKGKKKALPKSGDLTLTSLGASATPPIPNKDTWVDNLGKTQNGVLEDLLTDSTLDLGGKQVVFNDVLNDEPGRDEIHRPNFTTATTTSTSDPAKKSVVWTPVGPTAEAKEQKKKKKRKDRKGRKRLRQKPQLDMEDPGV